MKKALKIIVSVVIVLVILLFGVQWWLSSKIRHTAEQEITRQTGGRIKAEIGSVSVCLIGRTVRLKDVQITTDTTRQDTSVSPLTYADVRIPEIAVKGIHFQKNDTLMNIRARKFRLDISRALVNTRTVPDCLRQDTSRRFPGKAMSFDIGRIELRLGQGIYQYIRQEDTTDYRLRDFFCRTEDWKMEYPESRVEPRVSCGDMQMAFAVFSSLMAGKSQLLQVDSFDFRGREGRLAVGSVRLLPQYPKDRFALLAPRHADWTRVETRQIVCYGFDMQQMMREQVLRMDSVGIAGATIASYKNRQISQPLRVKKLFYESVQQFPVPLAIRRIGLKNIAVEYQELAEKGVSPGTVTFSQLEGTFYGLTNIGASGDPYFVLEARGLLMDQGDLQATFRLPVDSLQPHFEVEGRLGKMSALSLNSMVEPLTKIRIISGDIDGMTFKITGNSMDARVDMTFLYQDLKVRLLKEKDGEWKTRSFLTNIINGIVLDENNPDHRGLRQGKGTARRDVYRSQFNYLWKTLFAGLKHSVGL